MTDSDRIHWPTAIDFVQLVMALLDNIAPDLKDHMVRVGRGAKALAEALNLPDRDRHAFMLAGLLHDIGYLCDQATAPTDPLFDLVNQPDLYEKHPLLGQKLVAKSKSLIEVGLVIRHHHEHFDGSGFPDGLSGEDIPLGARLLAVIDYFERTTVDRPGINPISPEEAGEIIAEDAGIIYDPRLAKIFLTEIVPSGILDPPSPA